MAANELIRRLNQAGIESTRGTGVAATRKVYAQINPTFERPIREFADTSGTYAARRRVTYQRQRVAFSATDLLTYEDLPWWFQFALKGGVTATGDGGSPPAYPYIFVPSLSTDDLKSMTLEFMYSGNPYESTQVMLNTWAIRIDPDNEGGWIGDFELLGRDWATTTYTGSIADRTTEVIKAPTTKLYIDAGGGTIGTTQVTGRLISATVSGNNSIHFKAFAEDELAFAANKVGRGQRFFDAQITLEFDSDTEFDNFRSSSPVERKIRLQAEGTQIHGGTVTNKRARLDMNGYWSTIGWGDREGNIIATLGFSAFYNSTAGYDLSAEVVNALSTLP